MPESKRLKYKKILLRLAELTLKGKNRLFFTKTLIKNLEKKLHTKVFNHYDRLFVEYQKDFLKKLNYIFGVGSFSPVLEVKSEIKQISESLKILVKNFQSQTFKIKVKRHDKTFEKSSMHLSAFWGQFLLDNSNLKVNVKDPEILIEIEIRKKFTYISYERFKGLGGLPVGSNGKVLHLISGGIDSPVAAVEMMKRGVHVDFLNFITPPHTDEVTVEKVNKIVAHLNLYQDKTILYQSNFTNLLNLLSLASEPKYRINLMRRSFYRIASKIAIENKYLGISNGENLNQVASQTLESIITIQSQSKLPIYRPLLTHDKNEIIAKAIAIDTYHLSIIRAKESCEIFAPLYPVTQPKIEISEKLEQELSPQLENFENNNLINEISKKSF